MNAVNLHHAIFTNEKASGVTSRSAASFLHPAPEGDESPTSQLLSSPAYQDLIQRQPTHPNGPMSGWDLGLNLLGDPISAEEYKNIKDYQTKMKLRRLHAVNVGLELLFGIWGTYMTIRYFLAFADSLGDREHTGALVLGIHGAILIALVILSLMIPLFPQRTHPGAWRHVRSLLRASYLLLLCAGPVTNLVLVILWDSSQFCGWDIDISWYTSAVNTVASPCRPAPFGAWIAAAIVRLVLTWTIVLLFILTLRLYHDTRHPSERSPKYSPYFPSDPEDMSPMSTSPPLHHLKSKLSRSHDSGHMLTRSNTTLPKYTSISTLAPSTSCTGPSRSHSTPPPNDVTPFKISPPTPRRASIHVTHHGPTQSRSETSSQTQSANATEPSPVPHILRHKSRVSLARLSITTLSGAASYPDGPIPHESSPSETRSNASSRPGRGGSLDLRKTTMAWEGHARQASQTSAGSSFSSHESASEDAHAYGYGVALPAYPYLDMYNPQPEGEEPPVCPDASSVSTCEAGSSEEEYVAMMGGFVRRMATIESLGSREATSGMPSRTPGSSLRFASASSAGAVVGALSREGSLSTAYLSFSSGERVNERGELVPRSAASSPYDRVYYTATSGSFAH